MHVAKNRTPSYICTVDMSSEEDMAYIKKNQVSLEESEQSLRHSILHQAAGSFRQKQRVPRYDQARTWISRFERLPNLPSGSRSDRRRLRLRTQLVSTTI